MGLAKEVWNRRGPGTLTRNVFMLLYSMFTVLGMVFTGLCSTISYGWHLSGWAILGLALLTLAVGWVGIGIAVASDDPKVSLLGYGLVTGSLGIFLGPVLAQYTVLSIINVLFITGTITVVFGLVGAIFPRSLESWTPWLFGTLLVLLLGQFTIPFLALLGLPVSGALSFLDWIGVALFTAYVIYDVNRACRVEPTVDNAIDCAIDLYLDIINIFIRLLSQTGTKKD